MGTPTPAPATAAAPPPPRRSFVSRLVRGLVVLVVLVVALCAAYVWLALRYDYSSGDRAGYVQKFSRKGWVCKTWEGELAQVNLPGQPAELFRFTVRDAAVATRIQDAMGQRVQLAYEEHPQVPTTCFGETNYYVVGVRVIEP